MNDDLQQLRHVLQALALPVIGQVRLVPDDCRRIGALIGAFNAAYPPVCAEIDAPITAAQGDALARLEAQLAQVCGEATSSLRSELALRQSREWRQVRLMARETLLGFGWTLELPSLNLQPFADEGIDHVERLCSTITASRQSCASVCAVSTCAAPSCATNSIFSWQASSFSCCVAAG
jgi:hypothetical protein